MPSLGLGHKFSRSPRKGCGSQPRRLRCVVEPFQFLLVFACIHRLPEAGVLINVELALAGEKRQDFLLEVVPPPLKEGALFKNEETRIDPVIMHERFFLETFYLSGFIEHHMTILRTQRDGRQGCKRSTSLMGLEQGIEIEVT